MRPSYESSSEVFPSCNPSPAHSRTSGYSGKGPSPKVRSRDETQVKRGCSPSWGRHGIDEDRIERVCSPSKAPRHEVWVERARSPSPVCHERMEPSRSPSVPRGQERSPGVDTLLDYNEWGLSDDDFIGYDEFPKGFSGSSPEQSCDDEFLASPPRSPLTPLLVDSPKDNPGRVSIMCHQEEAGSARALPPDDGKSRGPWTGHQGVATAPGDEDSCGLRRTRGEALPPVAQRVNQDHAEDMNHVLWNPSTFVDQNGTYFQVGGTNLPTQSVLVPQVPIMNQPAAAAGVPGQQASDPKFTMKEFMDLMKFVVVEGLLHHSGLLHQSGPRGDPGFRPEVISALDHLGGVRMILGVPDPVHWGIQNGEGPDLRLRIEPGGDRLSLSQLIHRRSDWKTRVVEEVDMEQRVMKQVYQDFQEAVKSTKGIFTTLDREDKDAGGVTETSSTDKQDQIVWGSQQSLTRAYSILLDWPRECHQQPR